MIAHIERKLQVEPLSRHLPAPVVTEKLIKTILSYGPHCLTLPNKINGKTGELKLAIDVPFVSKFEIHSYNKRCLRAALALIWFFLNCGKQVKQRPTHYVSIIPNSYYYFDMKLAQVSSSEPEFLCSIPYTNKSKLDMMISILLERFSETISFSLLGDSMFFASDEKDVPTTLYKTDKDSFKEFLKQLILFFQFSKLDALFLVLK